MLSCIILRQILGPSSLQAIEDANEAHRLFPAWPKPLYRLAQAQLALGLFAPAVGACLKGESVAALFALGL